MHNEKSIELHLYFPQWPISYYEEISVARQMTWEEKPITFLLLPESNTCSNKRAQSGGALRSPCSPCLPDLHHPETASQCCAVGPSSLSSPHICAYKWIESKASNWLFLLAIHYYVFFISTKYSSRTFFTVMRDSLMWMSIVLINT